MLNHHLPRRFSEKKLRASYARVAWFYNTWSRLTESEAAAKVVEWAAVQNGERVLEVAVGTGLVFAEIVRRNPGGQNEGLDLSPAMLARAEKLLGSTAGHSHLQTGNAGDLPFGDGSFDLLVNNFMIDLVPEEDFGKVLTEFYRVLKPGGRAVISTMAFGQKWYNRFWHAVARWLPGLLTGCRPVDIRQPLVAAGFELSKMEAVSQSTFPAEVFLVRKPAA
jgi:ubiquinone/menaquinone biosynthesis C-methylase UbiE